MELKPIHQQVVVIMGASSGIGRETARRFAQQGARVVVSARSQDGLDSLVHEIRQDGGEARAIAAVVANAILHAAEHPSRDLFAGDAARMMAMMQAISPHLMDAILLNVGFSGQRTGQPKPAGAPDNLYAPIDRFNEARGDFGWQALPMSPYNAIAQSSGTFKLVALGVAAGALAALFKNNGRRERARGERSRRERSRHETYDNRMYRDRMHRGGVYRGEMDGGNRYEDGVYSGEFFAGVPQADVI